MAKGTSCGTAAYDSCGLSSSLRENNFIYEEEKTTMETPPFKTVVPILYNQSVQKVLPLQPKYS